MNKLIPKCQLGNIINKIFEKPTAEDAFLRYFGGTPEVSTNPFTNEQRTAIYGRYTANPFYFPPRITQHINGNDTSYSEIPGVYFPRIPIARKASNTDKNKSEYNILKRRFKQAGDGTGLGYFILGENKPFYEQWDDELNRLDNKIQKWFDNPPYIKDINRFSK